MNEDSDEFSPPPTSVARLVGYVLAWTLAFGMLGAVMWSTMTFQCMCGHTAMNAPLGGAIFGGATLAGLVAGWQFQKASPHCQGTGVLLAIALMFAGTVGAFFLAGNDLGDAHKNMFQPASQEAVGQVTF